MPHRTALRPTAHPASGSRTQTIQDTSTQGPNGNPSEPVILRLRGQGAPPRRGIRWAEGVIDNEGLGRKQSKVCCIYHRPHTVDSSSDDSSSDSDSEPDSGKARVGGRGKDRGKQHEHGRDEEGCGHHHHDGDDGAAKDSDTLDGGPTNARANSGQPERRRPSPNAYEEMKTYKKRGGGTVTVTQGQS